MSANNEICEITIIDNDKVNRIKQNLPDFESMLGLSDFFKVLGEPTRLKILLILTEAELCVCDISALLDVSISAISHHLRLLRNQRMVKFRKEGKMIYYSLEDDHIENMITEAKKHIKE